MAKKDIVQYKNSGNFNIGVVVFFIIIIYVLFNIFSYFTKSHIAEYQVQQGTIASNNIYQGIIVRDETIEYAEQDGYINYYIKNASKVSTRDVIYSIDKDGSISKEINKAGNEADAISKESLNAISLELDEILNVSDRIAVIYEGEIVGILETAKTNEQEIGLLMAGAGCERGEQ